MTTLAQHIFELPLDIRLGEEIGTAFTAVRLSIGYPGYTDDPRMLAGRFCFDRPARSLLEFFGDLDSHTLISSLHLPSDPLWLEWPANDGEGRVGALVGSVEDSSRLIVIGVMETRHKDIRAAPYIVFTTESLPTKAQDVGLEHLWSVPGVVERGGPIVKQQMLDLYSDILMCLAALCIPRVTEVVKVEHPRKLQRAREKRGRLPLIEYQQVRMNIKTPTRRYFNPNQEGGSEAAEAHRKRMHQVIGHFRTYQKGRERPHITWVPHHWRGDPELGILMHERHVKK